MPIRIGAAQEIDREILPTKNVKYFAFMDPKKEGINGSLQSPTTRIKRNSD
jgi:hypothetical protein